MNSHQKRIEIRALRRAFRVSIGSAPLRDLTIQRRFLRSKPKSYRVTGVANGYRMEVTVSFDPKQQRRKSNFVTDYTPHPNGVSIGIREDGHERL